MLTAALGDVSDRVREHAEFALEQIGTP